MNGKLHSVMFWRYFDVIKDRPDRLDRLMKDTRNTNEWEIVVVVNDAEVKRLTVVPGMLQVTLIC